MFFGFLFFKSLFFVIVFFVKLDSIDAMANMVPVTIAQYGEQLSKNGNEEVPKSKQTFLLSQKIKMFESTIRSLSFFVFSLNIQFLFLFLVVFKFVHVLIDVVENVIHALRKGDVLPTWGAFYSKLFMKVLRGGDLRESILEAAQDFAGSELVDS